MQTRRKSRPKSIADNRFGSKNLQSAKLSVVIRELLEQFTSAEEGRESLSWKYESAANNRSNDCSKPPKYRHQREGDTLIRRIGQFSKNGTNDALIRIQYAHQNLRRNCLDLAFIRY